MDVILLRCVWENEVIQVHNYQMLSEEAELRPLSYPDMDIDIDTNIDHNSKEIDSAANIVPTGKDFETLDPNSRIQ